MSDIRAGDVVVKVGGVNIHMRRGIVARVSGICMLEHMDGTGGLLFDDYWHETDEICSCFDPTNFRKIEAPKTELSERIRKCRPVARPVETALDRLAARLGHAPLSPDVAAGLEAGEEDRRRK